MAYNIRLLDPGTLSTGLYFATIQVEVNGVVSIDPNFAFYTPRQIAQDVLLVDAIEFNPGDLVKMTIVAFYEITSSPGFSTTHVVTQLDYATYYVDMLAPSNTSLSIFISLDRFTSLQQPTDREIYFKATGTNQVRFFFQAVDSTFKSISPRGNFICLVDSSGTPDPGPGYLPTQNNVHGNPAKSYVKFS